MAPRTGAPRYFLVLSFALLALLAGACGGDTAEAPPEGTPTPQLSTALPGTAPTPLPTDDFRVGRPLQRVGIGDVNRAFIRYERTRSDLINLFKQQDWFNDGLSRDESLFVERTLSFVARYPGSYTDSVSQESIRRKLYKYEKIKLSQADLELIIVYQPGDDADKQMTYLKAAVPVIEALTQVQYPASVLAIFNGDFGINDFNDGQFIRIDDCCITSSNVLAHELTHAYWSMGPSWFNEGMADIYAVFVEQRLSFNLPSGWRFGTPNLDTYYASRKRAAGRYQDKVLPRRMLEDGLYEASDVFLLDVRRIIGDAAFMKATREIYLASDFGRFNLRDKRIQDTFLANASPDQQDAIKSLFNQSIWGDNGEQYQRLKELEGN